MELILISVNELNYIFQLLLVLSFIVLRMRQGENVSLTHLNRIELVTKTVCLSSLLKSNNQ